MTAPDVYRLLLQRLHETGIEYMVTGAVAAIAYGEPRMTNDVDIVARLDSASPILLHRAFPEHSYYVPPLETIEEERQRARFGHFNIIHHETALRADVYIAADDPLHAWGLQRRRAELMASGVVWFAPVEYVIVRKLEYYRQSGSDRHVRDISGIVRISGDEIDMAALRQLVGERGLTELWELARVS
ncbi:MAG: hypothetical protein M3373_13605 [Gemmatimonadota bacterium]|nr:hypothetical protein [Gemmatimonadota bacterium]